MNEEIALGSVGVTEESLDFLKSVCKTKDGGHMSDMEDRPFDSIANAFKFAFALGFARGERKKKKAPAGNIAPRAFNARDFEVILGNTCKEEGRSLGALASEFAEGGIEGMMDMKNSGGSILGLVELD